MKILLVGNPRTVMGFNRLTKIPSLNLASLAANTDEGSAEIKIADLVVKDKDPKGALLKVLKSFQPDAVGFTAMSFQYKTALELAKLTKTHLKNAVTLLGGYHATADHENILLSPDHEYFDILIDGEGEVPFSELVKKLSKGHDHSEIPGITFRKNGSIVHNPRPDLLPVDKINIPLRNARIYKKGFHMMGMPSDVIETSRGCVFDCNFCSIRYMYGKSFRKFSIERILLDLEDAKRHGAKAVFIADDNITLDGKRYLKLCEEIAKGETQPYICGSGQRAGHP